MIWFDALGYCDHVLPSAKMTSISSAFENFDVAAIYTEAIRRNASSHCREPWLGGSNVASGSSYTWADGRPFQYQNWAPREPHPGSFCIEIDALASAKWQTSNCGVDKCFICELYLQSATTTLMPTTGGRPMTDCYDWLHINGATTNGIYTITPPGSAPFQVYCDMTTEGGGWTVIQRRVDGSLPFWNQTWADYKMGFNNGLKNSLWLGNDNINVLSTKDANVVLRIEMTGDRNPQAQHPNGFWIGEYKFSMDSEQQTYTLHATPISGNATSLEGATYDLGSNSGLAFVTLDRNGQQPSCYQHQQTGWWLQLNNDCLGPSSLNGNYIPVCTPPLERVCNGGFLYGFSWDNPDNQGNQLINPRGSEMKLRKTI